MSPQVSILMSFLDAASFIEEAIESVRAQTFPAWELILIDDGSTDRSTAIARDYAGRFPETMVYLEHPGHENRGQSASLNLGIQHARGRLLAMLDADDVWLPNKLEEQVALLGANPNAGMLYGNTLFWRSWSGLPGDAGRDAIPPLGVPLDAVSEPPTVLLRCLRHEAAVPCTCSVLMRREVVERVGGFEESFGGLFSDQAFYAKMLLAAPVYVSEKMWDKDPIHPGSVVSTAKRSGTLRTVRRRYLDFVDRYLQQRGLTHGPVWLAVQRERWTDRHPRLETLARRARGVARRISARVVAVLPEASLRKLRRIARPRGGVRFGNLRRVTPVSRQFGFDRGQPVDRHYIERFLAAHAADVTGRTLEVGDDSYTRRFGGARVSRRDVLHVDPNSPHATIVDDLATGRHIPSDAFDCVILTQTLHLIFDVGGAVDTVFRILRPGGVLLATVPGISPIGGGRWKDAWYWSFTPASMRRVFAERFGAGTVAIGSYGNVLTACAFLHGVAAEELTAAELAASDALYPLIVTIRARKPITTAAGPASPIAPTEFLL